MPPTDTVLATEGFDVANLPDGFDLVDALRQSNVEHGQGAPCWMLYCHTEFPGLTVGLHGKRGALYWDELDAPMVPVHGLNTENADYFTGGLHHYTFPPGSELPVDSVLTAAAEFVRTGQRPTYVEWRAET